MKSGRLEKHYSCVVLDLMDRVKDPLATIIVRDTLYNALMQVFVDFHELSRLMREFSCSSELQRKRLIPNFGATIRLAA